MVVRRNKVTYMISILVEGLAGGLWTLLECESFTGNLEIEDVVLVVDAIFGIIEC